MAGWEEFAKVAGREMQRIFCTDNLALAFQAESTFPPLIGLYLFGLVQYNTRQIKKQITRFALPHSLRTRNIEINRIDQHIAPAKSHIMLRQFTQKRRSCWR